MYENHDTKEAEFWVKTVSLKLGKAEFDTAKGILSRGVTTETITDLFSNALWFTDLAISKQKDIFHLPSPACKPGCSFCCYGRVGVIEPEVICLSRILRASLNTNELANLVQRTRSIAVQVRGLGSRERVTKHIACPLLLGDNHCLVYAARPIRCRGWNSFYPTECQSYWSDASIQRTPEGIALYDQIARHILGAMVGALRESQINADQLEFIAALDIALRDSSIEERWLAGEDVFHDAILADPNS